ncbi:MAG: ribosome small subunit-dependent GTPase A [Oscillospiraceae bacterium]|nr:ribosome small subunit-dependent GTPase A [Oscillospiraceae bacterium]
MAEGIIFKAASGFYYVQSDGEMVQCRARGRFRLEKSTPLVGDCVEFSHTEPGNGFLTLIHPRKNSFTRPTVANIDKIIIVVSSAIPVTDPYLIDTMTAIAIKNSCEPIICVNKRDLNPAKLLSEIYSSSGFTTIRTSAVTGEGINELREAISGAVCAFAGNSGVGKSSILNRLDQDANALVGGISKKLGRGRHMTRHVELFRLQCGAIIADTPGFSALESQRVAPKEELALLFPDFEPYLGKCRFRDCAHIKEPGCAVLEAVEQGKAQATRHASYARMFAQASEYKDWENKK